MESSTTMARSSPAPPPCDGTQETIGRTLLSSRTTTSFAGIGGGADLSLPIAVTVTVTAGPCCAGIAAELIARTVPAIMNLRKLRMGSSLHLLNWMVQNVIWYT